GPGAAAVIAGVAVRHATGIGPIIAYAIYAAALRLLIDQLLGPFALGTAAASGHDYILLHRGLDAVRHRGSDHGCAGRDWHQNLFGGAVRRTAGRNEAKPE